MSQFIGLEKLAVGGLTDLSVDRPVDRQRSEIRLLGHRSTGRSTEARIQRASLSVRSTGRSTGAFPESRALWTVDQVGRSALLPEHGVHVCARRSTARSTDFRVRSTVRSTG